jgi:hypothetical protein
MSRPTRRGPLRGCGLVVLIVGLVSSVAAQTGGPDRAGPERRPLAAMPDNRPEAGLIYDGLEIATSGPCVGSFQIAGTDICTHGPDPLPPDATLFASPPDAAGKQPRSVACDGDGVTGRRVQVMYVRAANQPDTFASALPSIRTWAAQMDDIVWLSAQETGGSRNIRFVTDAVGGGCAVSVLNVVIPAGADATFRDSIRAVAAQGYDHTDRKYVLFVDAKVYCGIGELRSDSTGDLTNLNNDGASYARVDRPCWRAFAALHELVHTLGGVQYYAPHSTHAGHCTDENDLMCYSDPPNHPAMHYPCPKRAQYLLDCNHDDYFHTNPPPGSYLATYWNSANAGFLIGAPPAQPSRPDQARVSVSGRNSATLTWRDNADETSYAIIREDSYYGSPWKGPATHTPQTVLPANMTTFIDPTPLCGKRYRFHITASNAYGTSSIDRASLLVARMPSCDTPDDYEPDNSAAQARPLAAGARQIHNLHTAGDADWLSFSLAEDSRVVLDSAGDGRRHMTLLDSAGAPIQSVQSSDGGALIGRDCGGDALGAGTYYALVDSLGGAAAKDDYVTSLDIKACANLHAIYLPLIGRE